MMPDPVPTEPAPDASDTTTPPSPDLSAAPPPATTNAGTPPAPPVGPRFTLSRDTPRDADPPDPAAPEPAPAGRQTDRRDIIIIIALVAVMGLIAYSYSDSLRSHRLRHVIANGLVKEAVEEYVENSARSSTAFQLMHDLQVRLSEDDRLPELLAYLTDALEKRPELLLKEQHRTCGNLLLSVLVAQVDRQETDRERLQQVLRTLARRIADSNQPERAATLAADPVLQQIATQLLMSWPPPN